MRARLAILASGVKVEIREILLKDKPAPFLAASAKGTVPVLETSEGVIDESRDVMCWALEQSDPLGWLSDPETTAALIDVNDGPFKTALDHTKYAVRFPDRDAAADRAKAAAILQDHNDRLAHHSHLLGEAETMADAALRPFVRQFANTDRAWFDEQDWPHLIRWLTCWETSDSFQAIMVKRPVWQPDDPPTYFP